MSPGEVETDTRSPLSRSRAVPKIDRVHNYFLRNNRHCARRPGADTGPSSNEAKRTAYNEVMAKPKSVNRYRSGVHNPQQEVHVYQDGKQVVVHLVDYVKGTVTTVEKKEGAPG